MENQQREIKHIQNHDKGYRGALIYRQEYGYKLITMIIDLRTPDEKSSVKSCSSNFDLSEEAEYFPAGSPLSAVDLYRFLVTDGMGIELTISHQGAESLAYYTVTAQGIEVTPSFLWLDVLKAGGDLSVSNASCNSIDSCRSKEEL